MEFSEDLNVTSMNVDGGIKVRLGDEVNGFVAEETFAFVDGILPLLQQAIAHFYPDSTLASRIRKCEQRPAAALSASANGRACPVPARRRAPRGAARHGGTDRIRLRALRRKRRGRVVEDPVGNATVHGTATLRPKG